MSNIIKEKVYSVFNSLGIPYRVIEHEALFSAADNDKNPLEIDDIILKNLFLRNKSKKKYYLYILPLYKKADLQMLRERLNESRLSFGNEDELFEKLNIRTGSVSLLNIIGVETTDVIFVIDNDALELDEIALHPNDNTASVIFSSKEMSKILDHYGVKYLFV